MTVPEPKSRSRPPWWRRIEHREMLVLVLVGVIGVYSVMVADVMPIMVTSWIHALGISERTAGIIATANFVGGAAGLFCALSLLTRLSVFRIALIGLIISTLGDGGCIFAHSVPSLCAARGFGDFGHGFVNTAVLNWLARHRHADRGFGAFMVLQVAVVAPMLMAVPALQALIGSAAPYVLLLGLTMISAIFLPVLRLNGGDAPITHAILPASPGAAAALSNVKKGLAITAPAVFGVAAMGVWSYVQRYGVSVGLSESGLADVLAAVMVTGIPAGLFVVWLGKRAGRTLPIAIGVLGMAAPVAVFTIGISSLAAFATCAGAFNIAWCVCIPFFQSIQADLDPTGRLVAVGNFPMTIGMAIGPAVFAYGLGGAGYQGAFLVNVALLIASLATVIIPAIAADHYSPRHLAAAPAAVS